MDLESGGESGEVKPRVTAVGVIDGPRGSRDSAAEGVSLRFSCACMITAKRSEIAVLLELFVCDDIDDEGGTSFLGKRLRR